MSTENVAISVQNISKVYEIGKKIDGSLRGTLAGIFSAASRGEEFYALKDVSFDIQRGEVIGIIGKNGAGKSTILKILSQITKPSKGRIEITGNVASLLEVGTGFHPELTGRENIYLNGTILGMSRKEVKAKFDEIVAFSGVEKFIDTPVKHYSSGMYVRLAFAVAAHLEPEILIIDEVLAVGDASFQKKCLGKMDAIAKQGRTVIFVSHDLGAVASLCTRGILMNAGQIIYEGSIEDVVEEYMNVLQPRSDNHTKYAEEKYSDWDKSIVLNDVQLINSDGIPISMCSVDDKIGIKVNFEVLRKLPGANPIPNIHLSHSLGGKILVSVDPCQANIFSEVGKHESIAWFPANFFNNGYFVAGIAISTLDPVLVHVADYNALNFEVIDNLESPSRNGYAGKMDGYLRPILEWENNSKDA